MNNNIVERKIKIREEHPLNVLSEIEGNKDAWIYVSEAVMKALYKEAFYHGRCEENEDYQFLTFHQTEKHPWKSILYSRGVTNGWFLYAGNYEEKAELPRIPKKYFYVDFDVEE